MDESSRRAIKCLSPLIGIFAASVLGWAMYFLSPDFALSKVTALDIASRTYVFLFALYGWGIGVVVGQQKNLYCGGTEELKHDEGSRRTIFWVVSAVLLIISAYALAWGHHGLYYTFFMLLVFGFFGEVGWNDPLKAIKVIWQS